MPSAHVHAVVSGLAPRAQAMGVARALRRAVMARVQVSLGERTQLAPFFTGHATDGRPVRRDQSSHLAFAFEPVSQKLLVLAPHLIERRAPTEAELEYLRHLAAALDGFGILRAGAAGSMTLMPSSIADDACFGRSRIWQTVTPYSVTRHAKGLGASAALAANVRAECHRLALPEPVVEPRGVRGVPGKGLVGEVRLTFAHEVSGPILVGRSRYFGGGLFRAVQDPRAP